MATMPFAETDELAVWRLRADGSHDVVLHKTTGRWAMRQLRDVAGEDDETRQERIADLARELDLRTGDGEPAAPEREPVFGFGP